MIEKQRNSELKKPVRLWFKRNFITGLLVLVPVMGTLFLFAWVFNKVTNNGLDLLLKWKYFEELYGANKLLYDILGRLLVIFVVLAVISLAGIFTRNLIGRWVLHIMERLFENLPFFNRIFGALKQFSKLMMVSGEHIFSYAVLFEYPRKGIYSIGFVMAESFPEVEAITGKRVLNIFFMTSPNPTTGFAVTVPKEDTVRLSMSVEEALRLVISGGAVVPDYKKKELLENNS